MKRRIYLESAAHIGCGTSPGKIVLFNYQNLSALLLYVDCSHKPGISGANHYNIKLGQ